MPPSSVLADRLLEAPVAPSFTRIGYGVRRRLDAWSDLDSYDLSGTTIAITGATSGLGEAAALQFARNGAHVILIARDPEKTATVRDRLTTQTGNHDLETVIADLSSLGDTRRAADEIAARHGTIDVLIHNAGALLNERRTNADGSEVTVAVHVLSPFLLTGLLLEQLEAAPAGRVLTMSSGGMYTAPLTVSGLEMPEATYRGTEQYAIAKRAQVTLNEMWAERTRGSSVVFHALHPGWADTPGVEKSLPTFRKVVGPLLRDPAQGADTLVWLAADDGAPLSSSGGFWHDRRPRPIHRLSSTRRADTPDRRERLWELVAAKTGWNLT